MAQLRRETDRLGEYGARLIVLGNGKPWFIQGFREKSGYQGTIYTDPSLSSFRALRLRRNIRSTFSLGTIRSAIRAHQEGFRQTKVRGDAWQQGGVFVISQDGEIVMRYASEHAGDHPPTETILRGLKALS